jgi:hypothetical protein
METVDDAYLVGLANRLLAVDGVVAVVLGGSRARGTHRPDSDTDLGLYYRGPLDVAALQALADDVADGPVEVTEPGWWGPWVDGGGWLDIEGHRVDWIYRDLARVERVWEDCRAGRYEVAFQVGHPLGFYSHAYAGEVALCRVLADPSGALPELQAQTREYPSTLGEALVRGLWEADFALRIARYGASGRDAAYVSGALFRLVGVLAQGLHGRARRWLINEKGAVAATASLPIAPPDFAERVRTLFDGEDLADRVDRAQTLIEAVQATIEATIQVTVAERQPGR